MINFAVRKCTAKGAATCHMYVKLAVKCDLQSDKMRAFYKKPLRLAAQTQQEKILMGAEEEPALVAQAEWKPLPRLAELRH